MSVNVSMAPNGSAIKFQSHRPRGYWLMENATPERQLDDKAWGEKLDSVTGVLGVLDKPALPWWGMETGIDGVLELVARGELKILRKSESSYSVEIFNQEVLDNPDLVTDVKRIAKLLTINKLTVNHVRDKAGDRGHGAHQAFETWCETGILPDPRAWPEDQRGYITGLVKFFKDERMVSEATEVMVASPAHRFGGRFDVRGTLDGKPAILDLKTSKRVYASHFLQMEGYEGASVELGYEPTEVRAVVHVRDGEYTITTSADISKDKEPCVYEDFLAVLRTQRVVKRLGGL